MKLLFLFAVLFTPFIAAAQASDSGSIAIQANPIPQKPDTVETSKVLSPNTIPVSDNKFRTKDETLATVLVLVFGVIVLSIAAFIIYKHGRDINFLFKYFIIILVIITSVVLLTVGYDKDQITPAIGLFGTIAGYLLGKSDIRNTAAVPPADAPQKDNTK